MPDDLVTLATLDTAVEAELVRSHLEAAEIPSWLDNAEMATALWHYGNAIGHVRLNVAQSQSQAALEVIEKMLPAGQVDGAVGPVESFDKSACLACGAAMPDDLNACSKCGWTFGNAEGSLVGAGESSVVEETETESTTAAMGQLRSWKRVFIWVWLTPILLMFGVTLVLGLVNVASLGLAQGASMLVIVAIVTLPITIAWRLKRRRDP
ncbi:MAG: hypothetical protein CMJ48_03515 [Planctomycetaceae bacterium]|nr:hypothetical protein [Planctomycetaceae bacterium]